MHGDELPRLTNHELPNEERVAAFVRSFLQQDSRAGQLLNPSNMLLYENGYRPAIGIPNDPEANGNAFGDLAEYFARKVYLDLNCIQPFSRAAFEVFLDQLCDWGYHTLTAASRIIEMYHLEIEGRFHFPTELAKIPPGEEQEEFALCWLNDAVLATEFRMLAWIFQGLFGAPYVIPQKRSRP